MPRLLLLAALVATTSACARSAQQTPTTTTAPAPAAAAQPAAPAPSSAMSAAGVYDFTTVLDGQEINGTATVTGTSGRYGGVVVTPTHPDLPISSVTVQGQTITLVGTTPDGDVVITMQMNGMDFTGNWTLGNEGAPLRGKKRP